MRSVLFLALVWVSLSNPAVADMGKNPVYKVEYDGGGSVGMVYITYLKSKPEVAGALRVAETQFKTAIDVFAPDDVDVMCTIWYHAPGTAEAMDDQVGSADEMPIYSHKEKKIMKYKDFKASQTSK